jgi:hypothetical protein
MSWEECNERNPAKRKNLREKTPVCKEKNPIS